LVVDERMGPAPGSTPGVFEQRLNTVFELRWDHRIGITEGAETLVRTDEGCI
jgi:hypothetical protein